MAGLEPFFRNQWLDALDTEKKWYESQVRASSMITSAPFGFFQRAQLTFFAHYLSSYVSLSYLQVLEVDAAQRRVKIHYKGWAVRFDEYIEFSSPRLAALHTHTKPGV